MTRYKRLEQYPDDMELLDDVIVEIRQAIEMTSIYRDDIKGTRELFSSILDNRLNNAMKYLTSVTLLMAVPTVISGLYGMNVDIDGMPFSGSDYGFVIVCLLTLAICGIAAWVLHKNICSDSYCLPHPARRGAFFTFLPVTFGGVSPII